MDIKLIMNKIYEGKNIVCIEMPENCKIELVNNPCGAKNKILLLACPEDYLETKLLGKVSHLLR